MKAFQIPRCRLNILSQAAFRARTPLLQRVMIDQAHGLETALMPSYTHLQRAIPVSGAHWLLSHFWPLERDRTRLRAAT